MALAVMLMMTLSCRKEQQVNTLNKKGGNTAALRLAPEELEAVTNDFITQSLSQQWNLGNYEYEDVVLMLEGALNYRTCTPHEYYDEIHTDSTSFQLSIYKDTDDNWYAEAERTVELWTTLKEYAEGVPERLQLENGFNIVADLEIANVDYEQEVITVSMVVWAGVATQIPIHACDFETNDYWNAISFGILNQCGNFSGCGINNGNSSSCARKEITRRINSQFCYEVCEASYYISISITSLLSGTYVNPNLLPCTGIDWTWNGLPLGNLTNECLSPYKLDCYTRGIKNVGNAIAASQGKCLVSVQIEEMLPLCSCPYMWNHSFYLGKPVIFNPN